MPFKRISDGPELQFEEMVGIPRVIASTSIFPIPSYFEDKINKSDFFIYG